jgi:hexokinase
MSVAEFLPNFEPRVRKAIQSLLGEKGAARIKMGMAKDGSGVGAALTALQAKKALDTRVAGAAGAPGKPAPTGQTGSG